jgi:hypothetical protein
MRFVAVKSAEQQGRLMQHRVRDLLMRQRTQLINALRAHLAELGIAAAQGREGIKELLAIVAQDGDSRLPVDAHASLIVLAAQLQAVQTMIGSIEKRVVRQHRSNEESKRLETIPGIGFLGATAIAATVPDPKVFRSGRDFAAWIGLVPRQDSTGGKQKLGPISKQGDRYLRRILVVGAHSVLRRARHDNLLGRVDAVNLEYVLGDIQTDRGHLHVDGSPHVIRLRRTTLWHSMPGAGVVHHIIRGHHQPYILLVVRFKAVLRLPWSEQLIAEGQRCGNMNCNESKSGRLMTGVARVRKISEGSRSGVMIFCFYGIIDLFQRGFAHIGDELRQLDILEYGVKFCCDSKTLSHLTDFIAGKLPVLQITGPSQLKVP